MSSELGAAGSSLMVAELVCVEEDFLVLACRGLNRRQRAVKRVILGINDLQYRRYVGDVFGVLYRNQKPRRG